MPNTPRKAKAKRPTLPRVGANRRLASPNSAKLSKVPSGIRGFDDLTGGGLPRGRPSIVCGGAGCGKTLFATEFLVRGALDYGEPGVFFAFEESPQELATNVASLGFDLPSLEKKKLLSVEYVHVDRSEIEESGEYNLEGLFVRIAYAVDALGAKRVVLDTLESLFGNLDNPLILRAELRRLFRWLKARQLTTVVTAERGQGALTRHGLEEYVSDCVIVLDHRINEQMSTRRLRVVKYRGSVHGTNEYPFLIDSDGFSVFPVTSLRLEHPASEEQISTGIKRLDELFGGRGIYRGSTTLISGVAGTGKTSFATHLAISTCMQGKKCIFFAHEESPAQLTRNMRSIGKDLAPWIKKGLLRVIASRPYQYGLEMHLVAAQKMVSEFEPAVVIVDPVTDLMAAGNPSECHAMMTRLIDILKSLTVTALFTSLVSAQNAVEDSEVGISSLIDTWIALQSPESGGERHRLLSIIKSRGLHHSNQTSEYVITAQGIQLRDAYLGTGQALVGMARMARESQDLQALDLQRREIAFQEAQLQGKRKTMQARVAALQSEYELENAAMQREIARAREQNATLREERARMAQGRWSFTDQKTARGDG